MCINSNPEIGLNFSKENFELMNQVKHFIFEKVCMHKRLEPFMDYANLIIRTVYKFLKSYYDGANTINKLKKDTKLYPTLIVDFRKWIVKYSNYDLELRKLRKYYNEIIYDIENFDDYKQAIIDFISSMTDKYIMRVYTDLITF